MPIIKSAKKAMRQTKKHLIARKPYKTRVKTVIKNLLELSKKDKELATKELSKAYKIIDTAAKKHILHRNNAARKKSRLAKAIANADKITENSTRKSKKTVKSKKNN